MSITIEIVISIALVILAIFIVSGIRTYRADKEAAILAQAELVMEKQYEKTKNDSLNISERIKGQVTNHKIHWLTVTDHGSTRTYLRYEDLLDAEEITPDEKRGLDVVERHLKRVREYVEENGLNNTSDGQSGSKSANERIDNSSLYIKCPNCYKQNFLSMNHARCENCGYVFNGYEQRGVQALSSSINETLDQGGISTKHQAAVSSETISNIILVDQRTMMLIKNETTRASKEMQGNRSDKAFTELEKALGYAAFINWLGTYLQMDKENNPKKSEFYEACNVSARVIATTVMCHVYKDQTLYTHLKKIIPELNTYREIELAQLTATASSNSFDAYWLNCTTRAVIMICRQMAYNYTGVLGQADFRLAKQGISWEELTMATDQWLNEVLYT
ncbi:hypothetical protein [Paenibacillus sabinae]|uniref:Uncharacterized protein n=1 Tax=Paenibacillus sabinae T27 TaxID=1268072 RepID=X4ZI60_9BACL|nr:hypothetical protein [Paenibacillus sabinae]AHV97062.1 hypothetical protein PSAB_10660 [Paenibacillus sabinae T27]